MLQALLSFLIQYPPAAAVLCCQCNAASTFHQRKLQAREIYILFLLHLALKQHKIVFVAVCRIAEVVVNVYCLNQIVAIKRYWKFMKVKL